MKNYRLNGSRRYRFKNSDRKRKKDINKINHDISSTISFPRRPIQNNNHNVSKLIEKYTTLAKEALSGGDKIMSENYFQHADHFVRILSEQEKNRANKVENISEANKNLAPSQEDKQIISEKKIIEK